VPGGAAGPAGPGLPIRRSLASSAAAGPARAGPNFHVQPAHLVIGGIVIAIVAVVLTIQLGPAKAQKEWAKLSEQAKYDVTDVVTRCLYSKRSQVGRVSRMDGPLPSVNEVAFFDSDVFWRIPESVGFNGACTEGHFKGVYHTHSGEVEATLGTLKLTGRRGKDGNIEAEINGKKAVILPAPPPAAE
jgi:hypothetical protein